MTGQRRVLLVKPGLVGPSTLGFMDEAVQLTATDDPVGHDEAVLLHERVRLDLEYLDRRSVAVDVQLLFRQAPAILSPRRRGGAGIATGEPTGPPEPV
jgi:lipopolysaccharide/colanic/teichoic acid biosynthesis glycosyltransferase